MKALVTGGAGFIGSNFVRLTLEERPDDAKSLVLQVRCLMNLGWREMALRRAREGLTHITGERQLLRLCRRLGADQRGRAGDCGHSA